MYDPYSPPSKADGLILGILLAIVVTFFALAILSPTPHKPTIEEPKPEPPKIVWDDSNSVLNIWGRDSVHPARIPLDQIMVAKGSVGWLGPNNMATINTTANIIKVSLKQNDWNRLALGTVAEFYLDDLQRVHKIVIRP